MAVVGLKMGTVKTLSTRQRVSAVKSRKPEPAKRPQSALSKTLWRRGRQVAVGLILLGMWALAAELELVNPLALPKPMAVAEFLRESLPTAEFWRHVVATLKATLVAFVLAGIVGATAGIGLALLPRLEDAVNPYLNALNALPRIALAPLFILVFGISDIGKVALAFTIVVFMVLSGARAGVKGLDHDIQQLATVLGAKKRHIFLKIYLPFAVPSIFASLRLGLIYSLLGVVTMELISARDGLGLLIQNYAGVFNTAGVYGVLICLALLATSLNALMEYAESVILRWQPPVKEF